MTKEEQIEKLRIFFGGEVFQQRVPMIEATHQPIMLREPEQVPWLVSQEEAEQVLHEYAPTLSVVISGSTMVVYWEKK